MTSPGWYPDPTNRFEFRYFDGNEWSSSVSRAGREFLDPAPSGLAAPGTTWQPQAPLKRNTPGALAPGVSSSLAARDQFLTIRCSGP